MLIGQLRRSDFRKFRKCKNRMENSAKKNKDDGIGSQRSVETAFVYL